MKVTKHCFQFKSITLRLFAALALVIIGLSTEVAFTQDCDRSRKGVWLWAGVSAPQLDPSETLYLHQGSLIATQGTTSARLTPLGVSPHKTDPVHNLILVYRLDRLEQADKIVKLFMAQATQWQLRGMPVLGIQLDFDSPSRGLNRYLAFLRQFRPLLPQQYKLSVTGLADWAVSADPDTLTEIASLCDEIVFQLYTGRTKIKNLTDYLARLARLEIEFKIGTLESIDLCMPQMRAVSANPGFRGYVEFILKNKKQG